MFKFGFLSHSPPVITHHIQSGLIFLDTIRISKESSNGRVVSAVCTKMLSSKTFFLSKQHKSLPNCGYKRFCNLKPPECIF